MPVAVSTSLNLVSARALLRSKAFASATQRSGYISALQWLQKTTGKQPDAEVSQASAVTQFHTGISKKIHVRDAHPLEHHA